MGRSAGHTVIGKIGKEDSVTDLDLLKSSIDIRGHAQRIGLKFDPKNKNAHCPNHDDKTPSLSFKKDFCKCFSCDWGGDVITLHQKVKGIDFKTAVDDLARMYNLNGYSKPTKQARGKRKEATKEASKGSDSHSTTATSVEPPANDQGRFSEIYEEFERLCGPPDGQALEYLTSRRRGLHWDTIERFRLFTIKDYKTTQDRLAKKFPIADLISSGLFNQREHLVFFKHTIVIPFLDVDGRMTYLRGRYFFDGSADPGQDVGKMLGLAGQTSKQLYNFATLKEHQDGTIYLAEGEFDTMVLEQYGYKAVGLPGMTAWDGSWMAKTLRPYRVEICIDNPKPGGKAAERKNIDNAVYTIASSLWSVGNYSTYRPQIPLDVKDITDFLVGMKGEFQE